LRYSVTYYYKYYYDLLRHKAAKITTQVHAINTVLAYISSKIELKT